MMCVCEARPKAASKIRNKVTVDNVTIKLALIRVQKGTHKSALWVTFIHGFVSD